MNPSFSPDIHRYSVIAAEKGATSISLTATAASGVTITVNGQLLASDVALEISDLSAGSVITINVQGTGNGAAESVEYEVLYLPYDFPELEVTILEPGVSEDPLYVSMRGLENEYAAILDNHGVPTFFKGIPADLRDFKWHSATGERSYARGTDTTNQWGRSNNAVVLLDQDFVEIDQIETVGLSHTGFHDFLITGNNELILVAYDGSIRDMTEFGLSSEELVEDSVVQIQDRATRQVLFEWSSWGYLPFDEQTSDTPDKEYAHINSVFEDFDGNLIMSFRGMSQIVKVARPSGQIIWRLGGKKNQFEFVNDPISNMCGQHTASRLSNGNILLFDNGQNCWPVVPSRGDLTRVTEYRLDEQNMTAELVWDYSQPGVYSIFAGSAQRLPNGNTLIGWGGGTGVLATEVTSDGTRVFEIVKFQRGTVFSYRARRYPE
jgi:hypothetical protein